MPFTHFALFMIFIEHQFKRVFKQNFACSFLAMTVHYTSNLLDKKKKKKNPTIERGKILIPFIKLSVRPTSTPSPKRDQLVDKMFQWKGQNFSYINPTPNYSL